MYRLLLALLIFITIASCTKDVPETEKKITKTTEEESIRKTIQDFVSAYNDNDIDKAISFFDSAYKGVISDSDDFAGIDALRNDLIHYRKQYPEGRWEITVSEISISGEYAYVLSGGSFLMPDIIEKKLNPIYSEKSIRILKRNKDGIWKIFRYVAGPTFTYDEK